MSLKVVENYIPKGHPNRPGTKLESIKARIWHGTANENIGATDDANLRYMGRAYENGYYIDSTTKRKTYGIIEKGSTNKTTGVGTKFRFGSAHVFIDKDSATLGIPLDEVCWGCGDRPLPYNNGFKGQTEVAEDVFKHRQNYQTWNIELCMNDMKAWDKVLDNALEFMSKYMNKANIYDFRHHDVTGKGCPGPMVKDLDSRPDLGWVDFRFRVKETLKESLKLSAVTMVNGRLNVRNAPSLAGRVVGSLVNNKAVTVLDYVADSNGGWFKIGDKQWVSTKFIKIIEKY